ncbi:hypothetical protein TNCV_276151 [Trichonephila clavipes]|nr:hypothetical protein TNCV_276151 [Trichonephila clavipes]
MSLLGVPFAVTNWKGGVRPSGCQRVRQRRERVLPKLVHDARSSIIASTSLRNLLNCKNKKTLSPRETILVMKQTIKKIKLGPFLTAVEDSKHQPSTPLTSHNMRAAVAQCLSYPTMAGMS